MCTSIGICVCLIKVYLNIYYGNMLFLKKKQSNSKCDENWLFVFKNSSTRSFLALGSNTKTIILREHTLWTIPVYIIIVYARLGINISIGGSKWTTQKPYP